MSVDPEGIKRSGRAYIFVLNNPFKFVDPDGRAPRHMDTQERANVPFVVRTQVLANAVIAPPRVLSLPRQVAQVTRSREATPLLSRDWQVVFTSFRLGS